MSSAPCIIIHLHLAYIFMCLLVSTSFGFQRLPVFKHELTTGVGSRVMINSRRDNSDDHGNGRLKVFGKMISKASIPVLISLSLLTIGPSYSFCDDRITSSMQTSSMQITAVAADNDNDDVVSGAVTNQRINTALSSGVRYYDVIDGDASSLPVEEGRTVQFLWSLRRSNGYFVDASSNYGDEPFIYKVGNLKKAIKGIDEGIRGMRPGGIRRISVPPTMAFIEGVEDGMCVLTSTL
jgi:hypothetical protein